MSKTPAARHTEQPAEGSRDVVERELARKDQSSSERAAGERDDAATPNPDRPPT